MEQLLSCLFPLVFLSSLLQHLLRSLRRVGLLALRFSGGFLCLWLLRMVSPITGLSVPVNPVTVLIAGFLGLPGLSGLILLELL